MNHQQMSYFEQYVTTETKLKILSQILAENNDFAEDFFKRSVKLEKSNRTKNAKNYVVGQVIFTYNGDDGNVSEITDKQTSIKWDDGDVSTYKLAEFPNFPTY